LWRRMARLALLTLLGGFAARAQARLGAVEEGVTWNVHVQHGLHMPRLGLGTAALPGKTAEIVYEALEAGVRLLDSAQAQEWYSEEDVGKGIARYSSEQQGSLDDLIIVTKIHPRSFRSDKLRNKVDESRRLLYSSWRSDASQIDVVLLHSPYCWSGHCSQEEESHSWQSAWQTLEELKEEGAIRAIGVSNFDLEQLQELEGMANVKVAVVQNWMDPLHQDKGVREFCKMHGITYMAYSSMGTQWESKFQHKNPVLSDSTLLEIAGNHKTSVANIVNSWLLQEGVIAIPRSSKTSHIKENAGRRLENGNLKVILSATDIEMIRALDGKHGTPWD
jgi:diketogulonate reductase-like aldo/keto reductase